MTHPLIQELEAVSPDAAQLAAFASIAARIDRAVLRAMRLELLADADATAESDLWYSALVARRTATEIVLQGSVLASLRDSLDPASVQRAGRVLASVRNGAPGLLTSEEHLIFLGLTKASPESIDACFGSLIAALRSDEDRAADIAGWALRALPRLPDHARNTGAALSLAFEAERVSGYAVELGEISTVRGIDVDESLPTTSISVRREHDILVLGEVDGPSVSVPSTTPRVLVVESGERQVVATIEPRRTSRVEVQTGDVVLTNLRGERWRARSVPSTMPSSDRDASENGLWILIDGNDRYELLPQQSALAHTLGRHLARAGYSMVTLGRPGVAHVAARSFAEALKEQGYTSCIYRLLHVVPEETRADYSDGGRTLFSFGGASPVQAAATRAHAMLTIGSSELTSSLRSNIASTVPFAELYDGANVSPWVLERPSSWTAITIEDFAARTIERLNDRLRSRDADPPPRLVPLVHRAATALDQRDLGAYNGVLETLNYEATSVIDAEGAHRLLGDPRRPSHRLLGYVSISVVEPDVLLRALGVEQQTVRQFWETRTLWFALDSVAKSARRADAPMRRALAAACASILLDLEANRRIDPGGECKERLMQLSSELPDGKRAARLAERAAAYASLRERLQAGYERTSEMTRVVDEIAEEFASDAALPEAKVWFDSTTEGPSIVGLALLLGNPDPNGLPIVERALRAPLSPFEQYTALRVAEATIPALSPADLLRLRDVLRDQRGEHGNIDDSDESRWYLSEKLLLDIESRVRTTEDPSSSEDQRKLAAEQVRVGDVQRARGDLQGARASFQAAVEITAKLSLADPSNEQWQRDFGIGLERLGDVLFTQSDLYGALHLFERALEVSQRLVGADPSNAEWQRDLGSILRRIGDVHLTQGDVEGARARFEGALDVFQRLVASDPSNAQWQRDFGISLERLSNVRLAQGDLQGARARLVALLRTKLNPPPA